MFKLPPELQPGMLRQEVVTALLDRAIEEGSSEAIINLAVFGDAPFTAQVIAEHHAANCETARIA